MKKKLLTLVLMSVITLYFGMYSTVYSSGICTKNPYYPSQTNHSMDIISQDTNPTCVTDGKRVTNCTYCNYEETIIKPAGHRYGSWTVTSSPTCTSDGSEKRTCSRCPNTETNSISALGHNYGSWTVTTSASCNTAGSKSKTCSICKKVETESIVALGHDYNYDGYESTHPHKEYEKCSRCSSAVYTGHYATVSNCCDCVGHSYGSDNICTRCKATKNVSVDGITLDKSSVTLEVDATLDLVVEISPSNASNKSVTWSSNNSSIAKVDIAGKVTGVAEGTATITATSKDNSTKKAVCTVTVTKSAVKVESVSLNKSTISLNIGGSETLTATISPSNATNKNVIWTSSDTSIATVDSTGKVTGLKQGTATIAVTSQVDSTKKATCTVSVGSSAISVSSISLNKSEIFLGVSECEVLVPSVLPANATNKNVTWTSSNNSIATVDNNGMVTAVAEGKVTITATSKDNSSKSAQCTVTVTETKIPTFFVAQGSIFKVYIMGALTGPDEWKIPGDNNTYYNKVSLRTISDSGYTYTEISGSFLSSGSKYGVIGGESIIFYVLPAPATNDEATVIFSN